MRISDWSSDVCSSDLRLLRQILVNLVSNALKFTPAGGTIDIVGTAADDGAVTITVQDSGAGMSPDLVELATRTFWRGRDQSGREARGDQVCQSVASPVGP